MMKIEIEIPDWAVNDNLYLITRNELVASKLVGKEWKVKSVRCNLCGACCRLHPVNNAYFPVSKDGSCINLVADGDKYICILGMEKLLACIVGEPEGVEYNKFKCCIEYK